MELRTAEYRTIGALDHAAADAISLLMNRMDAQPEEADALWSARQPGRRVSILPCRPTERPLGTIRSPAFGSTYCQREKPRRNGSPIPKGDTAAYPSWPGYREPGRAVGIRKRNET